MYNIFRKLPFFNKKAEVQEEELSEELPEEVVETELVSLKISYNKEKFKFKNICDFDIDETVVNKGKDFVTTTSINKENNYKVVIKYTLLDNGNLNANFVGDFKGVIIYRRYDE